MARNNSIVLKTLYREGVVWTILNNTDGIKPYGKNSLIIISQIPNSEITSELHFVEDTFYNTKQCRDYINKWHKENDNKQEQE